MSDEAHILVSGPSGDAELTLPWTATVAELFQQARSELGVGGSSDYELACADGVTMMNKLERTLQELRDRRICPGRRFALKVVPDGFK